MRTSRMNRLGVSIIGGAIAAPVIGLAISHTHEAIDTHEKYASELNASALSAAHEYGYEVGTLGVDKATDAKGILTYYQQGEAEQNAYVEKMKTLLIIEEVGAVALAAGAVGYVAAKQTEVPTISPAVA